jgi:LacI family transcriptional regulator
MDVSIPAATRERVLLVAKEMGYRPNRAAQALVRGRTDMVALWLPFVNSAHYARAQLEFAELAANDGFEIVTRLFNFSRATSDKTWEVDDWPVDGILMLDCHQPSTAEFAAPTGVPLVSLGALYDPGYDHVGVDIAVGVREAMAHLASEGCRRIAHLTCNADPQSEPRLAAYLAECQARELEPELIKTQMCSLGGARTTIREHVAAFGVPDAILAQTDDLAIAARRGLADSGIDVPADVLIVGCDGSEEGEFAFPSVSSIAQPESEMFQRSWQVLLNRMASSPSKRGSAKPEEPGPEPLHSEVLKARLTIRESSVRPG